jgi:hypothetical protein
MPSTVSLHPVDAVISGVRHQPDLSEEREIVLEVPIVCDTTVLHAKELANLGFAPGQVDRRQGERFRVCLVRFRKFPHGLWQLVETFPEALEVHGEADAFFGRLKDDESRRLPRT